ncbi:transmembrane protease serine 9 [Monomorium pharaonis]|uniref:transmembrane protease serine 9 n=1 Tax=Monomorium pharaonis TaxID=307658 RepID=UPI001745EE7D|nr:transmembrane protease serine 9 [Monomorium pharaonis]
MDLRFVLFAIFLILNAAFVCSTDDSKNKKQNSNDVRLSASILNNSFLQQVTTEKTTIRNNVNRFFTPSQTFTVNTNFFPSYLDNDFLNSIQTDSKGPISLSIPSNTQSIGSSKPGTTTSKVYSADQIFDPYYIKFPTNSAVSERKCDEYVEEIAGSTWITPLTGTSSGAIKVIKNCDGTVNQLVVGGTEARVGEFPHMVALGKPTPQFQLNCGGTLISHTWVLTAAHCTHGGSGGATHARIGFHKLTDKDGIIIPIKRTLRHEDYKPPALYADIGLVELVSTVNFSRLIRPACLYQSYDTVPTQAWISGWGVVEFSGEVSNELLKAQLNLVDNLMCTQQHNSSLAAPYGVKPTMICAGGQKNPGIDACQGDSGGPLQIIHPSSKCLFQVIGVTSFGQGCGMGIPGIYTKVSHYLQWIEENVWPGEGPPSSNVRRILNILVYFTCFYLIMNFCFDLVAIFLILNVASVQSTDNDSSKKKNSNKVQHSSDILNNRFLQSSSGNENGNLLLLNYFASQASDIVFPDNNYNPFPPSNSNPFLLDDFTSQGSDIVFPDYDYNPSSNSNKNPFVNCIKINTKVNTKLELNKEINTPVTQRSYLPPLPYCHTSASNTPVPAFTNPVPFHNNSTTSRTTTSTSPKTQIPPILSLSPQNLSLPVGTVSERKCEKYVNEVTGTSSETSTTSSSSNVITISACDRYSLVTFGITVVGGTEALVGEFPHMVALGKRNPNGFTLMCGGTLISHTWVLSAAHCTHGPNGGPNEAKIGYHKLTDKTGIKIAIKNIIRHPNYNPPTLYNDIALIQLENAVKFNTSIRPACLFQQHNTVPTRVWISGWGVTEFSGEVSNGLQKAQLDLIDNSLCTAKYTSYREVPQGIMSNMICAGDSSTWSKDTCQGDSGGPLQVIHPDNPCVYQVMGITSFGQGCATTEVPGVYTRVSHYLQWIEEIVWPKEQDS